MSADGRTRAWLLHEFGQPAGQAGLYLVGENGVPVEIGPAVPPGSGSVFHAGGPASASAKILGLSADASRVVFDAGEPGDEWFSGVGGPQSLLEYIGTGNSIPISVGVEENGAPVDGCASQMLGGQLHSEFEGGLQVGWSHNAISEDGKTIFLTDTCKHEIFARLDNGESGAHTVAISEPSKTDCQACNTFESEPGRRSAAYFSGASVDGSKVFFTTSQPLLGSDSTENLYEYNFGGPEKERVVRVSGGDGTAPNPVARVEGVMQVSEDGSHVYFVAAGVLTRTPNHEGRQAQVGTNNLYVFNTVTGITTFVATLASNDAELWRGYGNLSYPEASSVTQNGQFLVFASHADLTPDDTSTATQIFEYDAQTERLIRVSIGQEGYNDDGNTFLSPFGKFAGDPEQDDSTNDPNDALIRAPEYNGAYSAATYFDELAVSANGSYVVFESSDALTKTALDDVRIFPVASEEREDGYGPLYAENVYEYHEGNVYLISDGRDDSASLFGSNVSSLGTDPSGKDVFFTTVDQLVSQDVDGQVDIYDARVDGGFPPAAVPVECQGEACLGPLGATPVLLSPGSEFQMGGNPPLAGSTPASVKKPPGKIKTKAKAKFRRNRKAKRATRRARSAGHALRRGSGRRS